MRARAREKETERGEENVMENTAKFLPQCLQVLRSFFSLKKKKITKRMDGGKSSMPEDAQKNFKWW